ncbi:hypothetical protein COB11_06350 [Candidatus Aerophobetes bacterium]|uniref:histidine kinase n=1 Tax=Aerophobetes bacterium TaxID=2030807 RepID=A0A2A4YDY5_UNCAE|nr:MAG: hypothetical protein COB11_06350 [Candidatus Aerophobetes bacterium]
MVTLSEQELIQSALESSPAGVILTDTSGTIVYCNPKTEAIFGFTKDELLNQKIEFLLPENLREKHAALRAEYMKKPVSRPMGSLSDLVGQHKDGHEVDLEIGLNPVQLSGKTYIVCCLVDLSETKKSMAALTKSFENLKKFNKELENFAYVASHDLQEPIRKIQSFGELLVKEAGDSLNPEAKNYLKLIIDASDRMRILISNLLEFSRLTTRAGDHVDVNLNDTIKQVLQRLDSIIRESKAEFTVEEELGVIQAEPSHINLLFEKIIENALKFHKKDIPPKITIRGKKEKEFLRIEIEDNGIGFDMKFHDSIFMMFKRLHPKEAYPGAGIGLTICKKIILQHIGEIYAKSTPDQGSTFILELPYKDNPINKATIQEPKPQTTSGSS